MRIFRMESGPDKIVIQKASQVGITELAFKGDSGQLCVLKFGEPYGENGDVIASDAIITIPDGTIVQGGKGVIGTINVRTSIDAQWPMRLEWDR